MKCSFCGGERERLKPFIYECVRCGSVKYTTVDEKDGKYTFRVASGVNANDSYLFHDCNYSGDWHEQ
jgi:hypothetical protein